MPTTSIYRPCLISFELNFTEFWEFYIGLIKKISKFVDINFQTQNRFKVNAAELYNERIGRKPQTAGKGDTLAFINFFQNYVN